VAQARVDEEKEAGEIFKWKNGKEEKFLKKKKLLFFELSSSEKEILLLLLLILTFKFFVFQNSFEAVQFLFCRQAERWRLDPQPNDILLNDTSRNDTL
jgi:hypothetical protein